jgi:radical SAM protein with 4Fe4S-binding SPASM domain
VTEKREDLVEGLNKAKLEEAVKLAKRYEKETGVNSSILFWERDIDILHSRMGGSEYKNVRMCYFPWISTYIDVEGNVKHCPKLALEGGKGILGNIFTEKFEAIWNGERYRQARRDFKQGRKGFTTCEHCVPLTIKDAYTVFSKMIMGRTAGRAGFR